MSGQGHRPRPLEKLTNSKAHLGSESAVAARPHTPGCCSPTTHCGPHRPISMGAPAPGPAHHGLAVLPPRPHGPLSAWPCSTDPLTALPHLPSGHYVYSAAVTKRLLGAKTGGRGRHPCSLGPLAPGCGNKPALSPAQVCPWPPSGGSPQAGMAGTGLGQPPGLLPPWKTAGRLLSSEHAHPGAGLTHGSPNSLLPRCSGGKTAPQSHVPSSLHQATCWGPRPCFALHTCKCSWSKEKREGSWGCKDPLSLCPALGNPSKLLLGDSAFQACQEVLGIVLFQSRGLSSADTTCTQASCL